MTRRLAALAAASALLLGACSLLPHTADVTAEPAPETPSLPAGASSQEVLDFVYGQSIAWRDCGELDCASVEVPLDWTDPAQNPKQRVGSLLINPGGPGASGIDLVQSFGSYAGQKVLNSYDVIGFDPRGVGASNGVDCGDGSALDAYYVRDFLVTTEADLNTLRTKNADFAAHCRELTGPLLENVDTVSAARDMDVIRAVLGDPQLNYLGFSYGTQLGATYAELYPENVGRVVLDGAVDVLMPSEQQSLVQAAGFENALGNFITWCLDRDDCPLTGPEENARQQIARLATDALTTPYASAGDTAVNGNLMVYGIVVTLYAEENWDFLRQAIDETMTSGTATMFGFLGNFYLDRNDETGAYNTNSTVAFTAISCLDGLALDDGEVWDIAKQQDFAAQVEAASPTFGWWFSGSGGCDGWPYAAHPRQRQDRRADAGGGYHQRPCHAV